MYFLTAIDQCIRPICGVVVDAHGWSICHRMTVNPGAFDRGTQCVDRRKFNLKVNCALRRHGDNMSVDQLRARRLVLGIGPVEIVLHSYGPTKSDVHVTKPRTTRRSPSSGPSRTSPTTLAAAMAWLKAR